MSSYSNKRELARGINNLFLGLAERSNNKQLSKIQKGEKADNRAYADSQSALAFERQKELLQMQLTNKKAGGSSRLSTLSLNEAIGVASKSATKTKNDLGENSVFFFSNALIDSENPEARALGANVQNLYSSLNYNLSLDDINQGQETIMKINRQYALGLNLKPFINARNTLQARQTQEKKEREKETANAQIRTDTGKLSGFENIEIDRYGRY